MIVSAVIRLQWHLGEYHHHVFALLLQAEEITLTIGQAFDLAYKKFLESGGKDVETRKQIGTLQKRVRHSSSRLSVFDSHTGFKQHADTLIFLLINAGLVFYWLFQMIQRGQLNCWWKMSVMNINDGALCCYRANLRIELLCTLLKLWRFPSGFV